MRTTLTLDDDVAAKLEAEARRTGLSFKETVNTIIRIGLAAKRGKVPQPPFKVKAYDMGPFLLDVENVHEALDELDRRERDAAD